MAELGNEFTTNGFTFEAVVGQVGEILAGVAVLMALILAKWGGRLLPWGLGVIRRAFRRA